MVPNPNQLTAELRSMTDAQLQQYAQMHKDDPYILPMALSESNARKMMRMQAQARQFQPQPTERDKALMMMQANAEPMPEEVGIGALPAQNLEGMADGGIVGYGDGGMMGSGYNMSVGYEPNRTPFMSYADGGYVERYAKGGLDQYADVIREEARRQGMDPDLAIRLFATESAGDPSAVSPKGAVGLGQLMPAAAKEMGLDPKERTDPVKNIRASIGYFLKQQQKYGDTQKALVAYNWGPGNLEKHLEKNQGQINRLGLPKETANYLTKIMPVREARAEAEPTSREALIAQIPGQTEAGRAAPPPAPERSIGQRLMGVGEAGLSMLSGLAAIPAGAATSVGQYATTGKAEPIEKNIGRYVYAPRGEAGREYVEDIARVADELKIPAYVPGIGVPGRSAAATRAAREAEIAAAEAAAAQGKVAARRLGAPSPRVMSPEEAAVAKAKVEAPRLPPPDATPEQLAAFRAAQQADVEAASQARQAPVLAREAEAKQRTALEALRQDQEAAATATGRAGEAAQQSALERVLAERRAADAAEAEGVGARLGAIGAATEAAQQAAPVAPTTTLPKKEAEKTAEEQKDLIIDAAQKAGTPDPEQSKGWSNDDWLNFGFALLANRSPYFMEAIGTAGLKTLAARKEKEESDINREAKKALSEKYKAEAEYMKGERIREAVRKRALSLAQTQINAFKNSPRAFNMTPEQIEEESIKIYNNTYNNLLKQQGLATEDTGAAAPAGIPSTPPAGAVRKISG